MTANITTETAKTPTDTKTTRAETITKMATLGYDCWYFSDVAFLIAEGNDYDKECQKATDEIAKAFGIPTLTEDEDAYENDRYCLINEIVNDMVIAETNRYEGEDE